MIVYIEDQYGNHVRYQHGMNVAFGLLFSCYLRLKDILLRGGIFLINGRRIRFDDSPESLGLFPEHNHEITFVNLLIHFNHNDLENQNNYPLTVGNKRGGVIDVWTMRDVINTLIQRGNAVEVVPEGNELLPPLHKHYCMQERHESQFFQ